MRFFFDHCPFFRHSGLPCVFFLKLLNMLREYLFCLQSFNLLGSLLCSFVGQKRWLGLILPLGMQSTHMRVISPSAVTSR